MLIPPTLQQIIRVLLIKKSLKLREIAQEAQVSLGLTVRHTHALKSTGYCTKGGTITAKHPEKLLRAWAHTVSVHELPKRYFTAAERPQYIIKKIALLGNKHKFSHAFTLFSATEVVCPYVAPSDVHLYVLERDLEQWKDRLREENIFPAERGNIVCIGGDESYLYGKREVNGITIVSLPQLYVDLFSYGGQGEEAAEELLKLIKKSGGFDV